jgi:imidazolonepropionase-like amidohydrolase
MRLFLVVSSILIVGCPASEPRPAPPAAPAEVVTLAFRNVRVFDGERVLPTANVLVSGARISSLGDQRIPDGAEVIDGAGRTLLPGLIDAHVHIWDASQLEQSLVFGVTTVLDMFMATVVAQQLRASDAPQRADLRSAGTLATAPGGHGTQFGFEIPTLTGPEEAQSWVDARLAEGSDYIKIVFDDGRSFGRTLATLSRETVAALVTAAHARDRLAVVHVQDQAAARAAIDVGADGLVHIFRERLPDPDFGQHLAARKAFVTPTLAVLRTLYEGPGPLADDPALAPYLMPDARANLRAAFPFRAAGPADAVPEVIAQLRDAGVPILCGSDAPNSGTTYGATVHDELELLVRAGLTTTGALMAATAAPARAFRLPDRGRIASGLRADLLLVEGDPTADITRTRHIVGVWRGGQRLDREAYRARVAAAAPARAAPPSERGTRRRPHSLHPEHHRPMR